MPSRKTALVHESLEPLILVIRNQRVILDADLARLYGVTTKVFNQAVKRNVSRFPKDFAFQLTTAEVTNVRSQTVTSNRETIENYEDTGNRSQTVTGSQKHRDPRIAPYVFTEHGAIMAATIRSSPRAIEMSLYVVRAFVQLRATLTSNRELAQQLNRLDRKLQTHDQAIVSILNTLRRLTNTPPPKRREIGFTANWR